MFKQDQVISIIDQISAQIRRDIISGELISGERLREGMLADRFNVSRGPIRDALLKLTKEGLLSQKRNCGVTVNENMPQIMQPLMIKLRLDIEAFGMEVAIDKLEENDFLIMDTMLQDLDQALKSKDYTSATEIDLNFHKFLVFKAGGEDLVNLWLPIVLRMKMNYQRISAPKECVQEHVNILNALKNKDIKSAHLALYANVQ